MTDYYGSKAPRGGTKVVDFTVKKNGQPASPEPTEIVLTWKDLNGGLLQTSTLTGGGITRPPGSTAESDPSHFQCRRIVGGAEPLGPGYTVYIQASFGATAGPNVVLESYEVTESEVTYSTGGPTLASVAQVKEGLAGNRGKKLPPELTDEKIQERLSKKQPLILARAGARLPTDLTEQQQQIASDALATAVVISLLEDFFPDSEALIEVTQARWKRLVSDLEAARGLKAETRRRRSRMDVT